MNSLSKRRPSNTEFEKKKKKNWRISGVLGIGGSGVGGLEKY